MHVPAMRISADGEAPTERGYKEYESIQVSESVGPEGGGQRRPSKGRALWRV